MKKSLIVIIVLIIVASCKKENNEVITGTVQQAGGCLPNTWLILVTNGDAEKYTFLCKSSTPTSSFNCSNAIYIINMPASLSQLGKSIKFSKWKDNGLSCLSSTFAPHHLEVSDLSAE